SSARRADCCGAPQRAPRLSSAPRQRHPGPITLLVRLTGTTLPLHAGCGLPPLGGPVNVVQAPEFIEPERSQSVSHTFITVIASVPLQDVAGLRTSIMALGNPANSSIAAALDRLATVHFASLNVFEASAKDRGHLVFELSGDGPAERLLADFD